MLKIHAFRNAAAALALIISIQATAQNNYRDNKAISSAAENLSSRYKSICSLKSLAKTPGGKEILVLTIGTGERDQKPGIAVIGGVAGNYIAGREITTGFAENLLKEHENPEVKALLNSVTFYIFPDISPDASEQYFAPVKYERETNLTKTDNDRDFNTDEDPVEDLNGDGVITLIRVADPTGPYTESPEDKRVMIKADISKGQTGSYHVYQEGTDNDKDGQYNEDGPGGVNINRNFSFNHEEYGLNSGYHAMSEPETKAVADFLFDHYNIYMTIAFGPQDNLGQPMKSSDKQQDPVLFERGMTGGTFIPGSPGRSGREPSDRRLTYITTKDEAINKLISDMYHEITGVTGSPQQIKENGNFMEWAYFHYGRYSFSTPGWWVPSEKGMNSDVSFLSYAEKNGIEDAFVPWTASEHPDFPGKNVEIGGIRPFVRTNPPEDKLREIIDANYKFILAAAELHPCLEFTDQKTESAGNDVFRLTVKVHNKGVFATMAEAGLVNQWTRLMKITIVPEKGQTILSGQKIQRIPRLEGGGHSEFSWLISGKGKVSLTAGAVNTGIIKTSIDLK